ncbi:VTT domain-containing protein [Fimbriiglobus ruber]|uniref:DedA protein n=1 Tax=Fimbriiglobus ruber TaxID=1908690 RepID=A0A225DQU1_9BACT|nr:VTT domain-containing protein [Fimbriiglobus ruber]OWK43762.1 DedA protein [Fimbriiglobus ruber]
MEETLQQVWAILTTIFTNLMNPDAWQEVLRRPGVFWAVFIATTLIIFTETGLLVGFFLPGDSLLVTLGIVAAAADDWPVAVLVASLCVAAVVGDSVGYLIGYKAGPRLFQREKSFFFRKDYLLMAQDFYTRHGGKTIIIARFMPIIRTFAPVVAGIGKMDYKRFLFFNVIGGVAWIASMFFLGYTLHLWLEPMLKPILGENFKVAKAIDKIVIVIVLLSVAPMGYKALTSWLSKRKAARSSIQTPVA